MDDVEEPPPGGPNVSLADAAIAAAIGRAAASGRGPDRAPTLEQLLAAFGEGEATTEARARVEAALGLAGVAVEPDLRTAAPGQRLVLSTPGMAQVSDRPRILTAIYALGALVIILGTAFVVSQALNGDGDPVEALTGITISSVPSTTTTAPTTTTSTGTTTTTTGTDTATTTTATETSTTPTKTTTTPKPKPPAKTKTTVVVRLEAPEGGTFLCVDDGEGNSLFNGTLIGKKKFEAKQVLLNIGLATTRVTVNGKSVALSGSPTGLDVTRKATKPLASGSRPCA